MLVCCKTDRYINSLTGEDEGEFFFIYYILPKFKRKYRKDLFYKHHQNLSHRFETWNWKGFTKSEIKNIDKEYKRWSVNGYEIIPNCRECRYKYKCITDGFSLP